MNQSQFCAIEQTLNKLNLMFFFHVHAKKTKKKPTKFCILKELLEYAELLLDLIKIPFF